MNSKNQRGWGERRDPRVRQSNRSDEEEQGCVNKSDIVVDVYIFVFCEEQPSCVCEQEKCQVGEKYLSTGEE